jgi:hypothetical protein
MLFNELTEYTFLPKTVVVVSRAELGAPLLHWDGVPGTERSRK